MGRVIRGVKGERGEVGDKRTAPRRDFGKIITQ